MRTHPTPDIMTGTTLSHYQILHELGRGGMGIVYQAQDTKLDRTVAIKVLPPGALTTDDDRARFYREAKAAAALNHPNIAQIYEIDEVGGSPFIAMEFIDGRMLSDEIKSGPLRLEEVLRIALQIASALGAAHAKEIVHRDIKSANIMLAKDGTVKVLDFGLAKTQQSTQLTRMGSTLGTVAYMSPEQARGDEVDGRTDLYSLGTVLYEMVAGRLPFSGEYEQAVVYGILNEMPEPLTAVRTGVPMELERIVFKALSKDKDIRYQTASGIIADLKGLQTGASGVSRRSMPAMSAVQPSPSGVSTSDTTSYAATASEPASRSSGVPTWMWAALPLLLLAGLAIGWLVGPTGGAEGTTAVLRARLLLEDAKSPLMASITPDDKTLFYEGINPIRILAHDLASGAQREVERSASGRFPQVSPDGRWVYFMNQDLNQWWRAPVSGGVAAPIPGAFSSRRVEAGFAEDGSLVYSDSSWSLTKVLPNGALERFARPDTLDGPNGLLRTVRSPNGKFALYNAVGLGFVPIRVYKKESDGEKSEAIPASIIHSITESGHALTIQEPLFSAAPQTYATPINLNTGDVEGATVAIGARSFPSVLSPSGLLIYEELGDQTGQARPSSLYRVTSGGVAEPVAEMPGVMSGEFSMSSTGERVVVASLPELRQLPDIFIMDLNRNTNTRLTREGGYDLPVWGAGDRTVFFDQQQDTGWVILRRNADGTGVNEVQLPHIRDIGDQSLSDDGRYLLFNDGPLDLYVHDYETDSTRMVLDLAEGIVKPNFSPDNRYVVYLRSAGNSWCGSVEVVDTSGNGEPIQIQDQGCYPKWSPDGTAIYMENQGVVTRIPVTTDPVFRQTGPAETVFTGPANFQPGSDGGFYYDLDGSGTLWVSYPESQGSQGDVWMVVNWFEELNRLAPRDE